MQSIRERRALDVLRQEARLRELFGASGSLSFGEQGYNQVEGIVRETLNGIPLGDLWTEFNQALQLFNRERDVLVNMLSYPVTTLIETVYPPTEEDFEEASEFGTPKGIRMGKPTIMGYNHKFYDLAIRYTWKFLAENTGDQVRALHNKALEADDRLVFSRVMRRLFNPTTDSTTVNDSPVNVFPIYNGDSTVPPKYKGFTHVSPHTHFLTTGGFGANTTVLESVDVDAIYTHLAHHGYEVSRGYQHILLVNEAEGAVIRTYKVATGAKFDFIPGPQYGGGVYLPENQKIVGQPRQGFGLIDERIGTYGPWQIIEDFNIPAGYVAGFATAGEQNLGNLVGIREHENQSLRGLKLIPGAQHDYPLTDSYYTHGLGTGVRHRGAGVVMQLVTGTTYTTPAAYA